MPPEIISLLSGLGPTGALSVVMFYLWLKAKRNGTEQLPSTDHDLLIEIKTSFSHLEVDIVEIKDNVKGLTDKLNDHLQHPV